MIIIISGMPGAGKSSTADIVAKKLKYDRLSTGDIQRELAKERGMTITEWGEAEMKDKKYDIMVDDRVKEILEKKDKFVLDTWIGAFFAMGNPRCVKVFLDCDENECARRRAPQKRTEEAFETPEKAIEDMRRRIANNRERWLKYYNYDFMDTSIYDLIIDTTAMTAEMVADEIINYVKEMYSEEFETPKKAVKKTMRESEKK
jgi:CMP/dCMP kinase